MTVYHEISSTLLSADQGVIHQGCMRGPTQPLKVSAVKTRLSCRRVGQNQSKDLMTKNKPCMRPVHTRYPDSSLCEETGYGRSRNIDWWGRCSVREKSSPFGTFVKSCASPGRRDRRVCAAMRKDCC